MAHVLRGHGREVGLGATTEILLLRGQGLQFVGPLPAALQNYTTYDAAPASGEVAEAARALLRHLASAPSQTAFAAGGVDVTH